MTNAEFPAIAIARLTKRFGRTMALDGLDLTVRTGEVHGFLGPNGAGKTTTIRVLLGLLRADTGTVRILGADPWTDAVAVHTRLAYVPGEVTLWPGITGGETIDLLSRLRGGIDPRRRADLLERFDLDPTVKGRAYSKGNRQKVALVAALASDAELFLFDEPTIGLDPLKEVEFQQCVRELVDDGRTVLLSSHILAEVEALCDRVSIIRRGRTVDSGTLAELRRLRSTTISVETVRPAGELAAVPGVRNLTIEGHRARFEVETERFDTVLSTLAGLGVVDMTSTRPTLEDIFLRHYASEPIALAVAS
ncbi:ABC transporter ATP-binding protein [Nocardia rhizosphaerihabitans]|uniref:ABC transporter ATP-binding protein n=1 Tax=Nocardia rhizosphaerihabitans TaxID=1691570 RepID=A0ABQ2KEW3_9NOCA|nr:ABC transporter ATP-binding protein [Nocardia rhizosphaerihabitans]GGN81178.1 ABC transporter ATP-binding protein [Nocardia rhizosphaerihabitans]